MPCIGDLPVEVAGKIASLLDFTTLSILSIINSFWKDIAREHIFRTITLDCSAQGIEAWTNIVNNKELCKLPRTVILKAPRVYVDYENDYKTPEFDPITNEATDVRELYKDRDYLFLPDTSKILLGFVSRVNEFDQFEHVDHIHWSTPEEVEVDRYASLRFIPRRNERCQVAVWKILFDAINHRRVTRKDLPQIRNLTVRVLRDSVIECLTGQDHKEPILERIEHLDLLINDKFSCRSLFRQIRPTPFDHLCEEWILPISDRLRHLSINFDKDYSSDDTNPRWNYFSTCKPQFPQLEQLSLSFMSILKIESLDWICESTKLKVLRLDRCQIVRYLMLPSSTFRSIDRPQDWEQLGSEAWRTSRFADLSVGLGGGYDLPVVIRYPGAWHKFIDRLRKELLALREFTFGEIVHEDVDLITLEHFVPSGYVGCGLNRSGCNSRWSALHCFEKIFNIKAPIGTIVEVDEDTIRRDTQAYGKLLDVLNLRNGRGSDTSAETMSVARTKYWNQGWSYAPHCSAFHLSVGK